MRLIHPDYTRRIAIDGVPAPVRRPVDIDQSATSFAELRTLRIYQFDPASVIDGHAEEDEVFIVALAGTVELTMNAGGVDIGPALLSAPPAAAGPCAAYLPPGGAYRLVAKTEAHIAYARATPTASRPPKIFDCSEGSGESLLEEMSYAEKLQLRLLQLSPSQQPIVLSSNAETLVHVMGGAIQEKLDGSPEVAIDPWGTVALSRGEQCSLRTETSALALVVMAR